ncbi:hypothetical protein FB45DRAFT_868084 [Roridomyces roridus]|uniref:Uncharacterized protein n=1 Tax=Roridomyces roridus TaxID=1738132 RepID=A0AAD7BPS1_9AGAR|nr:hypothetical protein FB45DRAFT_868084 [Roridomyces roridus]
MAMTAGMSVIDNSVSADPEVPSSARTLNFSNRHRNPSHRFRTQAPDVDSLPLLWGYLVLAPSEAANCKPIHSSLLAMSILLGVSPCKSTDIEPVFQKLGPENLITIGPNKAQITKAKPGRTDFPSLACLASPISQGCLQVTVIRLVWDCVGPTYVNEAQLDGGHNLTSKIDGASIRVAGHLNSPVSDFLARSMTFDVACNLAARNFQSALGKALGHEETQPHAINNPIDTAKRRVIFSEGRNSLIPSITDFSFKPG